MAQQQVNHMHA